MTKRLDGYYVVEFEGERYIGYWSTQDWQILTKGAMVPDHHCKVLSGCLLNTDLRPLTLPGRSIEPEPEPNTSPPGPEHIARLSAPTYQQQKHLPNYVLGDGISGTEFGLLWPVIEDHGRCGCGVVEMKSTVGYFTDRAIAEKWIQFLNLPVPSKEDVRYALILNHLYGIESTLDVELERAGDRGFERAKEMAAQYIREVLQAGRPQSPALITLMETIIESIQKLEDADE